MAYVLAMQVICTINIPVIYLCINTDCVNGWTIGIENGGEQAWHLSTLWKVAGWDMLGFLKILPISWPY